MLSIVKYDTELRLPQPMAIQGSVIASDVVIGYLRLLMIKIANSPLTCITDSHMWFSAISQASRGESNTALLGRQLGIDIAAAQHAGFRRVSVVAVRVLTLHEAGQVKPGIMMLGRAAYNGGGW